MVTVRAFVNDLTPERAETLARVRAAAFPRDAWPAASLIGVDWLVPTGTEVTLDAVAVFGTGDTTVAIDRQLPDGGASGIVTVRAHGLATSYVSGVQGRGGGLARQSASVWAELGAKLTRVNASYADLVQTTTYIVGLEPGTYWALYHDGVPPEVWHLEDQATGTFVGVPRLPTSTAVVAVDAVAVTVIGNGMVSRQFIQTAGLSSQAVATTGTGATTVRVGGQTGRPGDGAREQAGQAVTRLGERLETAGGNLDDLVALTVYVAGDPDDAGHVSARIDTERRPDRTPPATTVVGIGSLYAGEGRGGRRGNGGRAAVERPDGRQDGTRHGRTTRRRPGA